VHEFESRQDEYFKRAEECIVKFVQTAGESEAVAKEAYEEAEKFANQVSKYIKLIHSGSIRKFRPIFDTFLNFMGNFEIIFSLSSVVQNGSR
jgi:hypothetical protein